MDTESLAQGQIVAGRYRVERCLGSGGMGAVYLVLHLPTGEARALKLLHAAVLGDAHTVERFRREANAPAAIGSEHVVRVLDADTAPELGGAPFLVMEHLRGRDLEHELAERGRLPAAEVLALLAQAAKALDRAHAMGIVHRDLKPENLFVTRADDGSTCLKILDFGIAKMTAGAAHTAVPATKTATGAVFGTPLYMAPEQAKGENAKVAPATDVWALGLITHKLLTGLDMWKPNSLAHLVALVAYEPLPPPSTRGGGLGPGFDAWFARCCDRDMGRRFRSAGEAVAALGPALEGVWIDPVGGAVGPRGGAAIGAATESDLARTIQYRRPAARARNQRGLWVVGAAVGLLVGLAVVAVMALREGALPRDGSPAASSSAPGQ